MPRSNAPHAFSWYLRGRQPLAGIVILGTCRWWADSECEVAFWCDDTDGLPVSGECVGYFLVSAVRRSSTHQVKNELFFCLVRHLATSGTYSAGRKTMPPISSARTNSILSGTGMPRSVLSSNAHRSRLSLTGEVTAAPDLIVRTASDWSSAFQSLALANTATAPSLGYRDEPFDKHRPYPCEQPFEFQRTLRTSSPICSTARISP